VLYTFPGSPTVYYGDEAGAEGFEDPFNRRGYPWGREDKDILTWYKKLGKARNGSKALQSGDIYYLHAKDGLLVFERTLGKEKITVCVNRGWEPADWNGVQLDPINVKILKQGAIWI
jgi:glycosidase